MEDRAICGLSLSISMSHRVDFKGSVFGARLGISLSLRNGHVWVVPSTLAVLSASRDRSLCNIAKLGRLLSIQSFANTGESDCSMFSAAVVFGRTRTFCSVLICKVDFANFSSRQSFGAIKY